MSTVFIVIIITIIFLLYLWNRNHFGYWKRHGVAFIPTTPFVGNVLDLLMYRCCFGDQFKQLYNHPNAANEPFVGIHVLHNHALLLREPELIKRILNTDFNSFSSRFETADPVGDIMGSLNLFFAKYEIWKEIHLIFTPLFAQGKVRQMFPLVEQIGVKLEQYLAALPFDAATNSTTVEVKETCALFTTDLISSLAFGVHSNSLENPKAEFRQMCIEVNEPRPLRVLHLFTMFFFPQFVQRIGTHLYSPEYEQFMRRSINFVIDERERSGLRRNDLIDIFVSLKRGEGVDNKGSIVNNPDFFVAQAAFLLLAGFDTSSSTITFALYELARHPELQLRLRNEIQDALRKDNGDLTYETVNEMLYLRMVVDEVLRLYPATSFLDRVCTAPNGYSMEPFGPVHVPKGLPVYISVLGLHRDPKHWPEPNKFDPERFSPEQRKSHVSMSYIPFGSGPRGCIGNVLGLLQVKTGLIHILKNYRIETCSKTPSDMKFEKKAFVLCPDGGTYLKFVQDNLLLHEKDHIENL